MYEILKQIATPAIITGLISSLYAYFQKKKEDYRKYVYENKQENPKVEKCFQQTKHRLSNHRQHECECLRLRKMEYITEL